jgi:hypothetical protein
MQKVLPQLGGKLFLDSGADGVLPVLPMETFRKMTSGGEGRSEGGQ